LLSHLNPQPALVATAAGRADGQNVPTAASGDGWQIDLQHSRIGFSAVHMGIITVHGEFDIAEVELSLNPLNLTRSSLVAKIVASSVRTGELRRDADLRSAHFLAVETFPWIVFVSTGVEPLSSDRFRLAGDLTIRDVTRPVELDVRASAPVADGRGGLRRGFTASGRIDRTSWGLTWNVALETGGWLVSEEVQIELDIAAYGPVLAGAVV
jgi:polyisoprenoid-binding protein YceI